MFALAAGCKKDSAFDAMESDANGYICLKCGAKYLTGRTVFLGPRCPKCAAESLVTVVGYECPKDKHLTIRAQRGDSTPVVCDICKAPVKSGMRDPREADLKAWGAVPVP